MSSKNAERGIVRLTFRSPALTAVLLFLLAGSASARAQVLFSPSGTYAFPVAGNVSDMAWTHYHWNGSNALDVLPAPNLRPGTAAFTAFERSPIVAVVSGRVVPADNQLGGISLFLFGDDGREYYYAHLASTNISAPTRVRVGDQIGIIGRTGRWSRYIEIHLHLAITSKWRVGMDWPDDVNVAEWIKKTFGLGWIDQNPIGYPAVYPHGSPLAAPYRIVTTFAQMAARNPDTASVRIEPLRASGKVPVYSTLGGAVRVMRATVFGLRVQVVNLHTDQTVVYSRLSSTPLETGDVVNHGQIVGYTDGVVNYMYFDRGVPANPTPSMAAAEQGSAAGSLLN